MRTFLVFTLVAMILGSVGCASSSNYREDYRGVSKVNTFTMKRDILYIQQVEREAARRGVQVAWVNPPYLRVEKAQSELPPGGG